MEYVIGDLFDGGGHGVLGVDGADDGGPAFVAALVLHANALDIGHSDEVLPDLFSQAVLVELFPQDGVSLTQSVESVAGDGTQATHAQTGAGERLTVYHRVREAQRFADNANLVLLEKTDRFDEIELKIFGETAYVMEIGRAHV